MTRMVLMASIAFGSGVFAEAAVKPIDRHVLVTRHNIVWNNPSGTIPLGNGRFCFNADSTGLQTFAGNTMADWGWHSFPLPTGLKPDDIPYTGTYEKGRLTKGQEWPEEHMDVRWWSLVNPQKFNLARVRLVRPNGKALEPRELTGVSRKLDLWTGLQTSDFAVDGLPVHTEVCVHPKLDLVAVRVVSELLTRGDVQIEIAFPYPTLENAAWVGDFTTADGHTTQMSPVGIGRADIERVADDARYHASLRWTKGFELHRPTESKPKRLEIRTARWGAGDQWVDVATVLRERAVGNRLSLAVNSAVFGGDPAKGLAKSLKVVYTLDGIEQSAEPKEGTTFQIQPLPSKHAFLLSGKPGSSVEFVCAFSRKPLPAKLPSFKQTQDATAKHWASYWNSGGTIDLSESKDPRWRELERRIVLSQYLVGVQSTGENPPAEAGLMSLDPWYSKFHMEMVWWHTAHYGLWNRWSLAEKQVLGYYKRISARAKALAAQLGYKGMMWPKMVGPEGRNSPWIGNNVLQWKQPHPMHFAELEYRLHPNRKTLEKWKDIVFGTADFMASYAGWNPATRCYDISPVMPVSEQGIIQNTVFELAYFRFGFDVAQKWRERLGLPRDPEWDKVRNGLAPLPVQDGVYLRAAAWPKTYTELNWEHPDPIGVIGMIPPSKGVDPRIARQTLLKVWKTWQWDRVWGWDFPWTAMAAARLGEPGLAVDALLKEAGNMNAFDERGVCLGGPCPYLPGNGGLLYAVALMAAGWDGAPKRNAPGFPADGSWVVRWEGLKRAL